MERVIIVGGGASGMVAAIASKTKENEVILLERNSEPLKKLLMTGNGKCNYLNEVIHKDCYHSMDMNIVEQILMEKNIIDVKEFFDSIGIIPKIKNGYYYPFSNQASTMKEALLLKAKECGINILCNVLVEKIVKEENHFIITCNDRVLEADKLVLACGSCAAPKTGSDGMGYQFLESFHHTIIKPLPALVQLIGKGDYFKDWDGVRSDCLLELWENGQKIAEEKGEVQFTSYGISGICTFNLSHFVTRGLNLSKEEVIKINLLPFVKDSLYHWLESYSKKNSKRNIKDLLNCILNGKLVNVLLRLSRISSSTPYEELSLQEKERLIENLSQFPVTIIGTKDFTSAQICNGGVKLTEINPHTMESLLVPNLYITGELLDMNGNCGGYNLTLCWISGLLAGKSIGEKHD